MPSDIRLSTSSTIADGRAFETRTENKRNHDMFYDRSMAGQSERGGTIANPSSKPPSEGEPAVEKTQEVTSDSTEHYFPDGGLEAWLVVFGGWCCLFTSLGWVNSIGVFQDYYENNQLKGYPPGNIAWILSTETFVMLMGAPIVGKIFDGYGPRYLLAFGTFFHIFGLMMASLSSEYYQFFLAQGICSAMGASALLFSATNCTGTWFSKRRALVFGIISSGASLGGVIVPTMAAELIPKIGFSWTMRAIAFLFLALLIIANFTVKSRLTHEPTPFRAMEFITPLTEPAFLCLTSASFFFYWGLFLPVNFISLQAESNGMPTRLADYMLSILNASSIVGRILPAWLGDRVGRFNIMIVTTYLSVILVLALWIPAKGDSPIIAFSALYGFSTGAFLAMVPALVAQLSDVRKLGVRTGTNFFVLSLATLTGNPIGGALVSQNNGGYLYLQIFCGATMFIGSTFFVASRTAQCGLKWKRI